MAKLNIERHRMKIVCAVFDQIGATVVHNAGTVSLTIDPATNGKTPLNATGLVNLIASLEAVQHALSSWEAYALRVEGKQGELL